MRTLGFSLFSLTHFLALALVAGLGRSHAHAQGLPREFNLTPETLHTAPGFLTQLPVPEATCTALSENLSLAVVGRHSREGKHLAVFKLDAEGKPETDPYG